MVRLPDWSDPISCSRTVAGVARKLLRNQLTVFNYHDVSDFPSEFCRDFDLNVQPEVFQKQIRWIKNNFQVVGASQVLGGHYDTPAAFVTFDDGFAGVFENALPILEQEMIPSMVFVNMAPILGEIFLAGSAAFYRKCQPYKFKQKSVGQACDNKFFAWHLQGQANHLESIRHFTGRFGSLDHLKMTETSKMQLGNHGYRHLNFARLDPKEIHQEISENEKHLRGFANYMNMFSYPFGQPQAAWNEGTNRILREAGIGKSFTAFPLPNSKKDAWQFHRVSCFQKMDTEDLFLSHAGLVTLLNTFVIGFKRSW